MPVSKLAPTLRPPSWLADAADEYDIIAGKFSYRLFASEDHWEAWTTWAQDPDNLKSFDISVSFASHAFSSYVMQLDCNLSALDQ